MALLAAVSRVGAVQAVSEDRIPIYDHTGGKCSIGIQHEYCFRQIPTVLIIIVAMVTITTTSAVTSKVVSIRPEDGC